MAKYIAKSANTRGNTVFHFDKDCKRFKSESREATENEIEYHELEPCKWCDPTRVTHLE